MNRFQRINLIVGGALLIVLTAAAAKSETTTERSPQARACDLATAITHSTRQFHMRPQEHVARPLPQHQQQWLNLIAGQAYSPYSVADESNECFNGGTRAITIRM